MSKKIQTVDLVVGKRYYLDITETISGVFKGRFNDVGDYKIFTDIIKSEAYDDCYWEGIDGEIEFTYMEDQEFSEYEIA